MVAILPMLLGIGLGSGASGIFGMVQGPMNVGSNNLFPVTPLSTAEATAARWRGIIDENQYRQNLKDSGINEQRADIIQQAMRPLADTQDLITAFKRQLLAGTPADNQAVYLQRMANLGIGQELANLLVSTAEIIGTPQDLIRFLVREVLTPELRQQLELDAEFPEAAIPEFARLNISEQYARNLWAAHWELPSVGQMAETFHRYNPARRSMWEEEVRSMGLDPDQVQTDVNDIAQLLKFADVGTKYRQRVLSTLFSNPGQIQLRWLVRFRFLTYEEAVYYHERQGLPPTMAARITQVVFCVQSITDWKAAIKNGATTWADIEREMDEWHVTSPQVRRIVRLKVAPELLEGVQEERQLSKGTLLEAFSLGQITDTELRESLASLGYDPEQINVIADTQLAAEAVREAREQKREGLTRTEIKKAIRKGTMERNEAVRRLAITGMSVEAANQLYDLEVNEDE